jgi:hypothetical protein
VVLAGAVVALIGSVALAVLLLTPSTHHVTVIRIVVPAGRSTDPHHALTITAGTPAAAPVAPVGSPALGAALLRPGAAASFRQLSRSLPGRIELAVSPLGGGSTTVLGGDAPSHGWSTTKVPVLVSLLRARGNDGLTPDELTWARAAITESDNQSVLDLFGDLEGLEGGLVGASAYIDSVLRLSGDAQTVIATASPPPGAVTTFGQTEWAPSEALKFFRALGRGCLLPAKQNRYVLGLMQHIVPSESWGLGSAGFGVPVAFKGGWGPEPTGSYLVRQSGIIDVGSTRGVAVAIVAFPSEGGSGSFATGTAMLTRASQWLRQELRLSPHAVVGCPPS